MPTKQSRRFERSSFRGLTIIEGQRSLQPSQAGEVIQSKEDRRRRSSTLNNSNQIREIIEKTVAQLNSKNHGNVAQLESAEERLKQVLAEAKESGYSSAHIFRIIGGTKSEVGKPKEDEQLIPKDTFVTGLQELGFKCKDEKDLDFLSDRFDINKDGFISLAEFQHFCYHDISSVAWKAERTRLEAASSSSGDNADENDSPRFDLKEIKYSAGEQVVQSTSKLFWKDNISVAITLRYCSDLDILSLQICNAESGEEYKTLYVKKSDIPLDTQALNDAVTLAIQTSDEKIDEGKDRIRQKAQWEFYSHYLVTRLQLAKNEEEEEVTYSPRLAKLHGDSFDSLTIDKPNNLLAPRSERHSADGKSIQAEFDRLNASLTRDYRSSRSSRKSAANLSSIVESALSEVLAETSSGV